MKEQGIHEGCIEQIQRLCWKIVSGKEIATDEKGRIRVDDWEMRSWCSRKIAELWQAATTENLADLEI
jgi:enoyl-[acyl-carrier protein] reductase/trans-2-enoyl-CoA reductase (NAD+)